MTAPFTGDLWAGVTPNSRGRLIRVTSFSEGRVSYEVLRGAGRSRAGSRHGHMSVASLRVNYRLAWFPGSPAAVRITSHDPV